MIEIFLYCLTVIGLIILCGDMILEDYKKKGN
jgi:hypothetical protein